MTPEEQMIVNSLRNLKDLGYEGEELLVQAVYDTGLSKEAVRAVYDKHHPKVEPEDASQIMQPTPEAEMIRFINKHFEPNDVICVCLIDPTKKIGGTRNIFTKPSHIDDEFIESLHKHNQTQNIYLAMNAYSPDLLGDQAIKEVNHNGRTEDNVAAVRNLYADADHDGAAVLEKIRTSTVVPGNVTTVLESSPGKFNIIWRVQDIQKNEAKSILRGLVREFDTDEACVDLARVLRIPGFRNIKPKYETKPIVKIASESDGKYSRADFKLEMMAPEPEATTKPADGEQSEKQSDAPPCIRAIPSILSSGDFDGLLAALPTVYPDNNPTNPEGIPGRDVFVYKVCCKLQAIGWTDSDIFEAADKVAHEKCVPVFEDHRTKAKSALTKPKGTPPVQVPLGDGYEKAQQEREQREQQAEAEAEANQAAEKAAQEKAAADVKAEHDRYEENYQANAAQRQADAAASLEHWKEFTDLQNARVFAAENSEDVRAVYGGVNAKSSWYHWDGTRWKEDSGKVAMNLAKKTVELQLEEYTTRLADAARAGRETKSLIKMCAAARGCLADYSLGALLRQAASEEQISVEADELDAHPNLLNLNNGTFDLNKMEFRPHQKEDLLTKLTDIEYDPDAKCPKWNQFIERIFRDKPYMAKYIQRVVGYFLTGGNPEQVFFIGHGPGGGGKTTFYNVLKALFGEYFRTAGQGLFMLSRDKKSADDASPAQVPLYGSRLVASEELDEQARLDCPLVKIVTGGGDVTVRPLYKQPFTYTPEYKILFLANHAPKISDFSGALEDRLRILKFDQRLRDTEEEIQHYDRTLIKELPGILNWALDGLRDWKEKGLQDPKEVLLETEKFMVKENVVSEWLEECTEPADEKMLVSEAFASFTTWLRNRRDFSVKTQTWFGIRMGHLKFKSTATQNVRYYSGLKFSPFGLQLRQGNTKNPVIVNGQVAGSDVDFNHPADAAF